MYRILTASSDSYITNKVINNKFRATDSNVGNASTLDLFKLFAESTSGSDTKPTELSRLLVKFDLNPLRSLTGSSLDISNSSFKCTLRLHDVYGGQTTPSNFKLILFPLSQSFSEGIGRDIVTFSDLDACNFITASDDSSAASLWFHSGADKQGLLGSTNIDIISSGNLSDGDGVKNLWKEQTFKNGTENLSMDITTIISATLKDQIPDCGFRISFSGSQETDTYTRFVKRFSSRHVSDPLRRPQLLVTYNDSIQDHHRSFFFNIIGSLFLNNFHRGTPANILSGASATEVTGLNSLLLTLTSGSSARSTLFSKTITGSQHRVGDSFVTGVYSASFAISQFESIAGSESALLKQFQNAGSASFTEIWSSLDGNIGYLTSSLTINAVNRTSFNNDDQRIFVNITNLNHEYSLSEKVRIRVFAEDITRRVKFVKTPVEAKSEIFTKMYYRVRDSLTNDIVVPFDTSGNGTLLSTDSKGMYFDFYMDTLATDRFYVFDFLIKDAGFDKLFTDVAAKFKVI